MSELKFQCPSCGQLIECDDKCAGDHFPCPNCAVLIQIPGERRPIDAASVSKVGSGAIPVTVPAVPVAVPVSGGSEKAMKIADQTGKVSYTPLEGEAEKQKGELPPVKAKECTPLGSAEGVDLDDPKFSTNHKPATVANSPGTQELRCVCPACHAELRFAVEAALRIVGAPHVETSVPQSADERERKIAAAREAHPVQTYSPLKPRLSYVLSGQAPPLAESEGSVSTTE